MNYVIAAMGAVLLLMGGTCYLLYERSVAQASRIGTVETQLKTAVEANEAKINATKQRATVGKTVRELPDPELLRRLQ